MATSPSGDSQHPIEIDSESEDCESETELSKVKSLGGLSQSQPSQASSSLPAAFKRKWSSLLPSSLEHRFSLQLALASQLWFLLEVERSRYDVASDFEVRFHLYSVTLAPSVTSAFQVRLFWRHTSERTQPPGGKGTRRRMVSILVDNATEEFSEKKYLLKHLHVHRGQKQARCTWPDCTFDSVFPPNVIAHIRAVHFKLPPTKKKKQSELNIVDDRDPYEFFEKIQHGLTGN